MPWWIWVTTGTALLGAELFVPLDFYLIFIGLAAIFNGLLVAMGLLPEPWMEWASAAVLALTFTFTLRKKAVTKFLHSSGEDTKVGSVGQEVLVVEEILPGETGKGRYRGSNWKVKNETIEPLTADKSYIVTKEDGIVLIVS